MAIGGALSPNNANSSRVTPSEPIRDLSLNHGLSVTWTLFYDLLFLHPWGMGFDGQIAQHIFHVRGRHSKNPAVRLFPVQDQEYCR